MTRDNLTCGLQKSANNHATNDTRCMQLVIQVPELFRNQHKRKVFFVWTILRNENENVGASVLVLRLTEY